MDTFQVFQLTASSPNQGPSTSLTTQANRPRRFDTISVLKVKPRACSVFRLTRHLTHKKFDTFIGSNHDQPVATLGHLADSCHESLCSWFHSLLLSM